MARLLIVTTVPDAIRGFLLPHVKFFRNRGWQVDGAARGLSADPECAAAFDRVWDMDWSRSPLDWKNMIKSLRQMQSLVEERRYDIVHVHTPIASLVTRFAVRHLRARGLKVIYTAHGFHFHEGGGTITNALYKAIEKKAAGWTDYLVVMNKDDRQQAFAHNLAPEDRLRYMPGIGLDTSFYAGDDITAAQTAAARREIGLSEGDTLFVTVAEFTRNKRHADVLSALAQTRDQAMHVAFCGEGPMKPVIETQSLNLGLQGRTHFLGFRTDVRVWFKAARAAILVSAREGLPRSIMESLCAGTPVIGSAIRGTKDLVETGGGILIKSGSVEQLAEAMRWMHRNPERARRMGEEGRRSMDRYDLKPILRMHDELYSTALDHRSKAVAV